MGDAIRKRLFLDNQERDGSIQFFVSRVFGARVFSRVDLRDSRVQRMTIMRTTLKTTKEKAKGEKTRRRKHPGNDAGKDRKMKATTGGMEGCGED